jgi:acetolactate synthase regulatory subunit
LICAWFGAAVVMLTWRRGDDRRNSRSRSPDASSGSDSDPCVRSVSRSRSRSANRAASPHLPPDALRVGRRSRSSSQSIFDESQPDATSRFARCGLPREPANSPFEDAVRAAASRMRADENRECDEMDDGDHRQRQGCWGCQHGATMHDGDTDNEQVNTLIRMIRENHGRMDNIELAHIVHRHHESRIRRPALAAGIACESWSPSSIVRHLRHHTLDPNIVFAENIRTLRNLMRVLRRRTMEIDAENGEERVDAKNVDLLLKTVKSMADMYARRPDAMLFGSGEGEYMVAGAGAAAKK